jgi:hypothetical protein
MPVSSGTNEIHIESIEIEGSQPFTFIRGDPSTPVIESPPNPVNASYNLESAAVTVATKIKNENKLEREKLLSMQKMMASFLQGALQDKREVSSYHALLDIRHFHSPSFPPTPLVPRRLPHRAQSYC